MRKFSFRSLLSTLSDENDFEFDSITNENVVIEPNGPDSSFGTEDPRAVFNPEDGKYYILYSSVENTTGGIPISKLALGRRFPISYV